MKLLQLSYFAIALVFVSSCGQADIKDTSASAKESFSPTKPQPKQLNISILWDLSDRIDSKKHPASPEHYQRDIEVIKDFTEFFKQDMDKKGAYMAQGKLKVFFTPAPTDLQINNLAKNMDVDLSQYHGNGSSKEKKNVFDHITNDFTGSAQKIYDITISNNKNNKEWDGSDIWRFFKKDVDQCIAGELNYRNILVILTDGYIYHKDSKQVQGNRSAYILPKTLKPFRKNSNWPQLFNSKDYGLITTRSDLQNLEILVLEVEAESGNKDDEDYIGAYLSKWFTEMGVAKNNFKIYSSDLPVNSKKRIEEFLKKS